MDQAAVSGYPTASDFDYTFSDGELQDILGFLETQQQQPDGLSPTPDSLALLGGKSASAGLQFQPHSAESLGVHTPSHSGDSHSGELELKRESSSRQGSLPGQAITSGHLPLYPASSQPLLQKQQHQHQGQAHQQQPGSASAPSYSQRTSSGIPSDARGLPSQAARVRGARQLETPFRSSCILCITSVVQPSHGPARCWLTVA